MREPEVDLDKGALAERYRAVIDDIADAAVESGRAPADLTTIVVTKFHPAAMVRALVELGHRDFGESRQQEFVPKAEALADLAPMWHFIGQLQSKKAARVIEHASAIHSLDRPSLLGVLAATGRAADVFIQVNLTDDPSRGGVQPADLAAFAEEVLTVPALRLRGLMAVAAIDADPSAEFERVRQLRDGTLLRVAPAATDLSMGMSGDYRAAIAQGATHLRIGTAITGMRPDPAYPRN